MTEAYGFLSSDGYPEEGPNPLIKPDPADYYCNACGKTVQRDSAKRWIRSYCDTAGRFSRLWRRT